MAMSRRAKKRIALLVTIVLLGGAAIAAAVAIKNVQVNRRTEEALRVGLQAHADGEHERAFNNLRYYVERRGDSGEAYLALARSRAEIFAENDRHLQEAIRYAQMADARLDGLDAKELLLRLYVEVGFASEASDTADRILALDPTHARAMETKTAALFHLGREREAAELAARFAEAHPDSVVAHELVIESMRRTGATPQQRLEYAEEVLSQHPEDPHFSLLAFDSALYAQRSETALAHLRRAASLESQDAALFEQIMYRMDSLRSASRLGSQRSRDIDDEFNQLLARAEAHPQLRDRATLVRLRNAWKTANYDEALRIAQAVAADPADASSTLLGWTAMVLLGLDGDASAIEDHLRQRHEPEAEQWATLIATDRILFQGRANEGRERLVELARHAPLRAWASLLIGNIDHEQGNLSTALDAYAIALEQEPGWAIVHTRRGEILLAQERPGEAIDEFVLALRRAPQAASLEGLVQAVTRLLRLGVEIEELANFLADVRRQDELAGGNALLKALSIRILIAAGRIDEAAAELDRLLELEQPLPAELAIELQRDAQGAGIEAAPAISSLIVEEGSPEGLYARANALAASGDVEGGESLLREAADARPADEALPFTVMLARYLASYDENRGVELLASLAEAHPKNAQIQNELLRVPAAWAQPEVVSGAIERLRDVQDEQSIHWRLAEAERILRHEPGRLAEVEHLLAPALEGNNADPRALSLVAQADLARDRPREAVARLQAAVEASPADPRLRLHLARLLARVGQTDLARTELRTLSTFRLPRRLAHELIDQMATLGMPDEALGVAQRRLDPTRAEDLLRVARLHEDAGNLGRANTVMEELLAHNDLAPEHYQEIADYFGRRGDIQRGLQALNALDGRLPSAEVAANRARFLSRQGDRAAAERLWLALLENDPSAQAFAGFARFLLEGRRYREAVEAVARGLERFPDDPSLHNLHHASRLIAGEELPPDAIRALASELAQSPVDREGAAAMVEIRSALERGEIDRAGHDARLRELTARLPAFVPAWQTLVVSLYDQGRIREAAETARRAATSLPNNAGLAELATHMYSQQGDAEQALSMAREWRDRTLAAPYEAEAAIAALALDLDLLDEARTWADRYQSRIEQAPEMNPEFTRLLLRVRIRSGRLDEAERLARPLIVNDPERWLRRLAGLSVSVAAKAPDLAVDWLGRLEGAFADDRESRIALAALWHDVAAASGRSDIYTHILELLDGVEVQDQAIVLMLRAAAHERLGDLESAVREYRAAVALESSNFVALNNLASALLRLGEAGPETLELAERAVALAEEFNIRSDVFATILDTLGQALLANGEPGRAAGVFERALQLDPFRPTLMVGHAEALVASDAPERAARVLRQFDQALLAEQLDARDRDRLGRVREALASAAENRDR